MIEVFLQSSVIRLLTGDANMKCSNYTQHWILFYDLITMRFNGFIALTSPVDGSMTLSLKDPSFSHRSILFTSQTRAVC